MIRDMRTILVIGQYNWSSFLLCLRAQERQHLLYVVVVRGGKKRLPSFTTTYLRTYAWHIWSCHAHVIICYLIYIYIYSAHVSCQFVVKLFGVVCVQTQKQYKGRHVYYVECSEVPPRQIYIYILYVFLVPSLIVIYVVHTVHNIVYAVHG